MKGNQLLLSFLLACAFHIGTVYAFTGPRISKDVTELRAGAGGNGGKSAGGDLKDYSSEVSSLFGNLRVPAALFAGASAGAAFAMPIGANDGLRVGIVKRIYALVMMGALSSELLAIVVSTLTMGTIACQSRKHELAETMGEFIQNNYDLEWAVARCNFLLGLLGFVVASGMRAWVSIACPVFARAALGVVVSYTLLALAFIEDTERTRGGGTVFTLGVKCIRLLLGRVCRDPLFAAGVLSSVVTWGYVIAKIPHVAKYLAKPH